MVQQLGIIFFETTSILFLAAMPGSIQKNATPGNLTAFLYSSGVHICVHRQTYAKTLTNT